jgi:hypothetical protein
LFALAFTFNQEMLDCLVFEDVPCLWPVLSTRKSLQAAAEHYKPIDIFLNMESAIRMEFFDFKKKWDAVLPRRSTRALEAR